jgi:hypothetical protein
VLGGREPGSSAALRGIAFVAQETPLYKTLSVADMLPLPATCPGASIRRMPRLGWPSSASR